MATGSDDSEFAEFNSSKVRKEFKERQEKLKRKEISSRKFGRMMVFDIVGDLYKDRKTCKNELMKLRMSQKIKTFSRGMSKKHKVTLSNSLYCLFNALIKISI